MAKKHTEEEEIELQPTEPDYKELWLRAQADLENLRKRFEVDRQSLLRYGQESLIEELLPVIDNFDRATSHVPAEAANSPWVTGIQYIQKNLMDVLEAQGVRAIEAKPGQPFDHDTQEAVGTVETDEVPEDHIAQVVSKGYRLHDKLLRPVRVSVAKQPTHAS